MGIPDAGKGLGERIRQLTSFERFERSFLEVSQKKKELVIAINEAVRKKNEKTVTGLLEQLLQLAGAEDEAYLLLSGEWMRREKLAGR